MTVPSDRTETLSAPSGERDPALAISCILCTFNRVAYLGRVLEGMLGQTLPREAFEIVLVDDGSTEDVYSVVRRYTASLPIHLIKQENSGLAAAKNAGLSAARAPIILFMDDDDVPGPSLLEEHLRTHASFPQNEFAVLGHTNLHPSIAADPLMQFVTQIGRQLFSYGLIDDGAILDYTWFWGGRSSCKRALLEACGLFNPVFRFGCEDIELGYRLASRGLKVVYNRNAVSTMLRAFTLDEFCRRTELQGRSNYVFSRLHRAKEIQAWGEVENSVERWRSVAPRYDELVLTARRLDAMANARLQHGIALDTAFIALLHQAYYDAIDASRMKGIASSREAEQGEPQVAPGETAGNVRSAVMA